MCDFVSEYLWQFDFPGTKNCRAMVMEMNQLPFLFQSEDLHVNHKRLLVPVFL